MAKKEKKYEAVFASANSGFGTIEGYTTKEEMEDVKKMLSSEQENLARQVMNTTIHLSKSIQDMENLLNAAGTRLEQISGSLERVTNLMKNLYLDGSYGAKISNDGAYYLIKINYYYLNTDTDILERKSSDTMSIRGLIGVKKVKILEETNQDIIFKIGKKQYIIVKATNSLMAKDK